MKNSKIKLLSVAACLALVGTASAAWAYAGTATQSASIGVKVAAYADAGTITVSGADKINVLLDSTGVSFVRSAETDTLSATYAKPSGFESATNTVNKTFTVIISPALYNYVTFDSTVTNTEEMTYGNEGSTKRTAYVTWTDGEDIFSKLPKLAWQDGKNPQTENEYKAMIKDMNKNTNIDIDNNWDDYNFSTVEWNSSSSSLNNSLLYIDIMFEAEVQTA